MSLFANKLTDGSTILLSRYWWDAAWGVELQSRNDGEIDGIMYKKSPAKAKDLSRELQNLYSRHGGDVTANIAEIWHEVLRVQMRWLSISWL